ncbi:putative Ig domain-containing protein, partial [Novipirellula herctigrandis]|uniref:putative Ig domain-containing protein n=1 Tax=Novipirellula herctigrandis TaxID=2527986 RepID=UPI003AF35C6E
IDDRTATEDNPFTFSFSGNTFGDPDGDALSYVASLADDSALPSWLTFTPVTRTFSGTPLNPDVGTITVKVTATDPSNATVSDEFALTVGNTNDVPILEN